MSQLITVLEELDHRLFALFEEEELNSEEILLLIDKRERILQETITEFESVPGFKDSPDWQDAISRTRQIVELMQLKTRQLGEQLKKYRHGNKSVQRYQQFL